MPAMIYRVDVSKLSWREILRISGAGVLAGAVVKLLGLRLYSAVPLTRLESSPPVPESAPVGAERGTRVRPPACAHVVPVAVESARIGDLQKRAERDAGDPVRLVEVLLAKRGDADGSGRAHRSRDYFAPVTSATSSRLVSCSVVSVAVSQAKRFDTTRPASPPAPARTK